MTRVSALLLLAVVLSALYLVRTQYESRRLYTELDRAKALAQRLDTEHDRLDVERGAQATPLRVEKLAREQLHMNTISPAITQYVSTQGTISESVSASSTPKAQP
jgi:cell division protein FtsL